MKRGKYIAFLFGFIIAGLTVPDAHADTLAGRASVIDGDTLEIHGERIRLLDIDAPESRQTCGDPAWRCGQKAALVLAEFIQQKNVWCETAKRDRYRRWLARCQTDGPDLGDVDLSVWLTEQGWAVPYRDCLCYDVRAASAEAQAAKRGIWSGEFEMPWDFRKKR